MLSLCFISLSMVEVFLEMLGWTLPTSWVWALWGEVWQGHCACGTVSRHGRFQCWQELPGMRTFSGWWQKEDSLTWRSPFAPQHRPCVVAPVSCLRLGGHRGVGRPETSMTASVPRDGHISGTFPLCLRARVAPMSVNGKESLRSLESCSLFMSSFCFSSYLISE